MRSVLFEYQTSSVQAVRAGPSPIILAAKLGKLFVGGKKTLLGLLLGQGNSIL